MDESKDLLGLTEEQADTERLLRDLLGTAIADRYRDFCRLASGSLPLTVSRPLAGHALRELDSTIRDVLATPLDARAIDDPEQKKCRRKARRMLRKMGFDDGAVQRAGDGLKPRFSHKAQIEKIVARLGLAPDGDVAKMWIELNATYGRVHERSFYEPLDVDENFRALYARRFDTVVRVLAVQLQSRYAALMRRVREIASMPPVEGIEFFVSEIPGAVQLQGYFYENLPTEDWLPYLSQAGLLREPLPEPEEGTGLRLWKWPVGRYLVRLASSENATTRRSVAQAIRNLASSRHPDVQHFGLDVIAALPPAEAAELTDVVAEWLKPDSSLFQPAPHTLIARLAQVGYVEAALKVVEAVFQVFERNGGLAGLFDATMYEHYLKGAVDVLAKAGPLSALPRFADLLMRASHFDRRLSALPEEDYTYYTVGSLRPNDMGGGDILATLIRAIVRLVCAAVDATPENMRSVLEVLASYKPRIFRRIELHVMAKAPREVPDRATACLSDTDLIPADWCREEYGELALAWFAHLSVDAQQAIFSFIDSLPEAFTGWRQSFEQFYQRKVGPEDEREHRETVIRDVVWLWREALPADRKAALDRTVAEFGDPDSWRTRHLPRGQISRDAPSMRSQPVEETVAYLRDWRPDRGHERQTAGALANELREAAAARPELFSAGATRFAELRPLFIRHSFDGLTQEARNAAVIDWGEIIGLTKSVIARAAASDAAEAPVPGDDPDWSWTVKSAIGLLAIGLGRGADGIGFMHADAVRACVIESHRAVCHSLAHDGRDVTERRHPFFSAEGTARGVAVELCLKFLYWQSQDPSSAIGKEPRSALIIATEICAILDAELSDHSPAGWIPRAVLGHYVQWLFYFGEAWLRARLASLFPPDDAELRKAAWQAYLQSNLKIVADLVGDFHTLYAEDIAALKQLDLSADGKTDGANQLAEHLMVLYLWDRLPETLLEQFWDAAPDVVRRRAMWFIGRHLPASNPFSARAKTYWDRRLHIAARSANKELYRAELGTIGVWFVWDIDPSWLMDQLLLALNAGLGPTSPMGVIDKIAEQVPEKTDQAVTIMKALVREPKVEAFIFASEGTSLRKILTEDRRCRQGNRQLPGFARQPKFPRPRYVGATAIWARRQYTGIGLSSIIGALKLGQFPVTLSADENAMDTD